jgi:hypothetical protein
MDVASERGHVALTILVILDWAAAASRRWRHTVGCLAHLA